MKPVTYPVSLVFVLLSVVFLVGALIGGGSVAYVMAVLCSGTAIALLLRRRRRRAVHTFVSSPPPANLPLWSRSVHVTGVDPDLPVELEIDHVVDGYRRLLASEILPVLETLSVDELRKVIRVEEHERNRAAIVERAQKIIDLTIASDVPPAVLDPNAPTTRHTAN